MSKTLDVVFFFIFFFTEIKINYIYIKYLLLFWTCYV